MSTSFPIFQSIRMDLRSCQGYEIAGCAGVRVVCVFKHLTGQAQGPLQGGDVPVPALVPVLGGTGGHWHPNSTQPSALARVSAG